MESGKRVENSRLEVLHVKRGGWDMKPTLKWLARTRRALPMLMREGRRGRGRLPISCSASDVAY